MKRRLVIATLILIGCSKDDEPIAPSEPIEEEMAIQCEQSSCWDASIYACRDATYIELFTRSSGWTGGDATYSVDLENGKTLWMFGDSFIDQVSEDGSRPSFRLIRNAMVLQDGDEMITYHSGTSVNPSAYAKPPEENDWYWPGDGTVVNGKLYLFMHGFGTGGGGMWDFFRTSIDLLAIDIETMEIENNQRLFDDPMISWGAAILEDDDYTYVYGVKAINLDKYLYVSRTNADLTDPWEYYDGADWVTDASQASQIFDGVSEQFSVWKDGGSYYFLTQHHVLGREIYIYNAEEPQGSFEEGKTLYCTPETGGNIFTYNAFAHPHVYSDSLLVSYNINSFDFNDLLESADNYRPYFVRVGNWRKTN